MIFGKIEYLNLLPFHLFLKRYLRYSIEKKAWQKRGSVPASINRAFRARRIDAAVISSIRSRGCRCTDFGIVADGEVQSVLLLPGVLKNDAESDSSNILARVLGMEGEVIIGDKALRYFLAHPGEAVDLAAAWRKRESLPFVFARLCAHPPHIRRLERITKHFFAHPQKIPYRTLKEQAVRRGIEVDQLKAYLGKIHYRIGWREKRALKRFFRLARGDRPR
ncbi:MqnA/MqnD/SBP family protein [Hydrogenimonas urashimensis]|uniref:MqnA/MqnD/SBP family protein n=1 Tax=Hydrogenimonas urashimensis TaxID=2740515 RepID=UPI001915CB1D|nr:MqnA/MqnD/SBP family protein [Hydrogenimonas urashimensis]